MTDRKNVIQLGETSTSRVLHHRPVLSPVQQLRLRNKADSIQSDECVIFNNAESDNVNGPENDRKRRQASFTDRILASLVKKQVQACGLWSDQVHRVEQFVMVRSLPGCKQQWPHTDYNMDFRHGSLYNEYPAPLGAILALQDGTTLMVRGQMATWKRWGYRVGACCCSTAVSSTQEAHTRSRTSGCTRSSALTPATKRTPPWHQSGV